ncbi:MAG: winged helix DNA-binding domain-containing protein [Candidatus Thermoplasmatota archaeon]|nr:winged helix DNA-binding domain-containing protein [Candidatus Thermoplasmatota archaeon]
MEERADAKQIARVVDNVCGVQAQVMSAAQIALWARIKDIAPEDVENALWKEKSLVKTWCMRSTVHIVPSDYLSIYTGAVRRSMIKNEQSWIKRRGGNPDDTQEMINAIGGALGHECITRKELTEKVVVSLGEKARKWVGHGWGGIMKQACLAGLVCFGPNRWQEITFVRCDSWLRKTTGASVEKSENELMRRYLGSYGPASLQDFSAWSGIPAGTAIEILENIENETSKVSVEGKEKIVLRKDLDDLESADTVAPSVRLLPSFDSYMLGHRNKSHLVDEAHYKLVYRKAGWLSPVVLSNGRAIGTWSYEKKDKKLAVAVNLFEKTSAEARKKIENEAANLGHFFNIDANTTFV